MSAFAALTANMMELGFWMNFAIKDLICDSISSGCSPTGTLVRPEKNEIIIGLENYQRLKEIGNNFGSLFGR